VPDLKAVFDLPRWHPPVELLELAELVLIGALPALPVAVTVPAEVTAEAGRAVVLEDAEGTPVAVLHPATGDDPLRLEPLQPFGHGPARSGRLSPSAVRRQLAYRASGGSGFGSGGVLAVPVTTWLSTGQVDDVLSQAVAAKQQVLWLAVFGAGRPSTLPPTAFWRAVNGLADVTDSIGAAVAVPVLGDERTDAELLASIARAYGGTEVFDLTSSTPVRVATLAEPGFEPPTVVGPPDPASLHFAFAAERERTMPAQVRRGVTVFFTGLSGSGKSTVAKALADRITERTPRTVSLLDGDEVRRLLSAGLGFSRADRDLNIRRIGYVATEVSRHGGLAICAPIAPFAQARAEVRADVEAVGDLVLIHVSTPLAECERRDRKGLYAKARAGLIPDFTGISSPYEEPVDADLRLDTTDLTIQQAVDQVWQLLAHRGYLGL
jgi:sulfate adenylyltransferase